MVPRRINNNSLTSHTMKLYPNEPHRIIISHRIIINRSKSLDNKVENGKEHYFARIVVTGFVSFPDTDDFILPSFRESCTS